MQHWIGAIRACSDVTVRLAAMIREMDRALIYLKVEVDVDEHDTPEKLGQEILRQVRKLHNVRDVEVTATVEH